jgi:hypothetical protein
VLRFRDWLVRQPYHWITSLAPYDYWHESDLRHRTGLFVDAMKEARPVVLEYPARNGDDMVYCEFKIFGHSIHWSLHYSEVVFVKRPEEVAA